MSHSGFYCSAAFTVVSLSTCCLAGSVILESPVLPVMEGDNVTLGCRSKTPVSNLKADFYRDDVFMESSPAGEMTINRVRRSDERLYRCSIAGVGASAGSWLAVRGKTTSLSSSYLHPSNPLDCVWTKII